MNWEHETVATFGVTAVDVEGCSAKVRTSDGVEVEGELVSVADGREIEMERDLAVGLEDIEVPEEVVSELWRCGLIGTNERDLSVADLFRKILE